MKDPTEANCPPLFAESISGLPMMEAWFHADPAALEKFYGDGFRRSALRRNPRVEEISKDDLLKGLNSATKRCGKDEYGRHKADHGAALLEGINPLAAV